jgi:predicted naringenin-chalcone synthase
MDNIAANLLFADGAAAALVCGDSWKGEGLKIKDFYSCLELDGITDMAWNLSSKGFLMRLSSYIPQLIEKGFKKLVENALKDLQLEVKDITHWAIHPGGRKILDLIYKEMEFQNGALESSYQVLKQYGNMSSPSILFVLKDMWESKILGKNAKIFGAAFGPGLTMETFVLEKNLS